MGSSAAEESAPAEGVGGHKQFVYLELGAI